MKIEIDYLCTRWFSHEPLYSFGHIYFFNIAVKSLDLLSGVGSISSAIKERLKEPQFRLCFDFRELSDIYSDTTLKRHFKDDSFFIHFVSSRRKEILVRHVHETRKALITEDCFSTIFPINTIMENYGQVDRPYFTYLELSPMMPYIAEAFNYDSIQMGPRKLLYSLRYILVEKQNGKKLSIVQQQECVNKWVDDVTANLYDFVIQYRRDLYISACRIFQEEQETKRQTIDKKSVEELCSRNRLLNTLPILESISKILGSIDSCTVQESPFANKKIKQFRDSIQYEDKQHVLNRLHFLIDGKGGKEVGIVLAKAYHDKLITKIPSQKEFETEFTLNGSWRCISNYTKFEFDNGKAAERIVIIENCAS